MVHCSACYKFVYRHFNFCGYLAYMYVSLTAFISFTGADNSPDVTRKGCTGPVRHGKNTKIDKNKQIQHWSYKDRKHFIVSTNVYYHFMIIIRHLFYVTNSMTFRQTFHDSLMSKRHLSGVWAMAVLLIENWKG